MAHHGESEVGQASGAAAPAPLPATFRLPPPPPISKTSQEIQDEINEVCRLLIQAGVPPVRFSIPNILEIGITTSAFIRTVKSFVTGLDADSLDELLIIAVREGTYNSTRSMTAAQLWTTIKFFKSPRGRGLIEALQRGKKLEAKRVGAQTVSDVTLTQVLQLQIGDMSMAIKKCRGEFEERIADLQRQLNKTRSEQELAIATIKDEFNPAAFWFDPPVEEITKRSWELYVGAMTAQGGVPVAKTDSSLLMARETYGGVAISEVQSEFVRQENNREALIEYLKGRITHFDAVGETRPGNTFRRHLASLGVTYAAPVAAGEEADHDGDGASGEGSTPDREAELHAPEIIAEQPAAVPQSSARDKRPAEAQPELRTTRSRGGHSLPHATAHTPKRTGRGRGKGHRGGKK